MRRCARARCAWRSGSTATASGRRPRRDAGLEHLASSRSLVRHHGNWRDYHTVNPRLFPEQIVWIVNHAQDRMMLLDLTFIPMLEKLASQMPSVQRYVVLADAKHMPETSIRNAVPYEEWIGEADGDFAWKTFDENTAAGMCYTSGTTGHPKGVLYSIAPTSCTGLWPTLPI